MVTTPRERNLGHLKRMMRRHRLTCVAVADLIGRRPQTIRAWRSGRYPVPDHAIKLLKLQLDK